MFGDTVVEHTLVWSERVDVLLVDLGSRAGDRRLDDLAGDRLRSLAIGVASGAPEDAERAASVTRRDVRDGAERPLLDRLRFEIPSDSVRCLKLADYGLVINLGNGIYSITEEGEEYLAGELDAANLEN